MDQHPALSPDVSERVRERRAAVTEDGKPHLTPKTAWILVEEGTPQANDKEVWGGSGSVPSALRVNPTPPPEVARRGAPAGTPEGSCLAGTNRLMSSCGR